MLPFHHCTTKQKCLFPNNSSKCSLVNFHEVSLVHKLISETPHCGLNRLNPVTCSLLETGRTVYNVNRTKVQVTGSVVLAICRGNLVFWWQAWASAAWRKECIFLTCAKASYQLAVAVEQWMWLDQLGPNRQQFGLWEGEGRFSEWNQAHFLRRRMEDGQAEPSDVHHRK